MMMMNSMSSIVMMMMMMVILLKSSTKVVVSQEFVGRRDTSFVWNGSSFAFNGFNSYWMMQIAAEQSQRHIVSDVFQRAQASALTVCRTWAFSDGGDRPLQKSPGVFDERFFQALDFVIAEARKYGMKLIMTLGNNWSEYGGKHQYVEWAKVAGAKVTSDDDFFTNPLIKSYYKNYIKSVLTRMNSITKIAYKDDPTIMAWELLNEPRCQSLDPSGKIVTMWIKEMAIHLKSIDNKHLLGVGLEGYYGDSTPQRMQYNPYSSKYGTDFITNNLIQQIDFTSIHAYPDIWLERESEDSKRAFMRRWLTIHWSDSNKVIKKPLVFAEFGKSSKVTGYTVEARDSFMSQVYLDIYNLAKGEGTIGGGLVWQIMGEGMESYYDGLEIVLSKNPSTENVIHAQSIRMSGLRHPLS